MYVKMVKDLTIEDLERMRDPEYLGEQADFMIATIYRVTEDRGFSDEEIREMSFEEIFEFDKK
jgi:hypothetical protein